jgi:hypothetical protein
MKLERRSRGRVPAGTEPGSVGVAFRLSDRRFSSCVTRRRPLRHRRYSTSRRHELGHRQLALWAAASSNRSRRSSASGGSNRMKRTRAASGPEARRLRNRHKQIGHPKTGRAGQWSGPDAGLASLQTGDCCCSDGGRAPAAGERDRSRSRSARLPRRRGRPVRAARAPTK